MAKKKKKKCPHSMSAMMEICEGRKNCKKAHTRVAAISKIDAKALPLRDVAELDFRKKPCMSVLGVRPHFIGVFRRKDAIQWSVVAKCLKSFSPSLRGLKPVVECLGMPKIFVWNGIQPTPLFLQRFQRPKVGLVFGPPNLRALPSIHTKNKHNPSGYGKVSVAKVDAPKKMK